jgi:hypothetical protein
MLEFTSPAFFYILLTWKKNLLLKNYKIGFSMWGSVLFIPTKNEVDFTLQPKVKKGFEAFENRFVVNCDPNDTRFKTLCRVLGEAPKHNI